MTVLKSYKINEYITLKLEKLIVDEVYKKKTNIIFMLMERILCSANISSLEILMKTEDN